MIDLYIGDYKADVEKDFDVILSKNNEGSTTPHAFYNSFSIGVVLPGTKNNDLIFNKLFSLNFDSGYYYTEYDPFSKVNFILQNGGITVERGYIKLNKIINNRQDHRYDITLYGWFMDFWYRLQYDEAGKTLSLNDLVYGWQNEDDYWTWNRQFVVDGWERIMKDHADGHDIYDDVVVVPTYSGFRDGFDSQHILFDYQSYIDYDPNYANMIPNYDTFDGTRYDLYDNKYMLIDTLRDIDEWEAYDLRASNQRWGLRIGAFVDSIISYAQNIGYQIDLSRDIRADRILNTGYFIFDTPEFIEERVTDTTVNIFPDPDLYVQSGNRDIASDPMQNIAQVTLASGLNTSLYGQPKVHIEPNIYYSANNIRSAANGIGNYGWARSSQVGHFGFHRMYGLTLMRIDATDHNGVKKSSKDMLIFFNRQHDTVERITNMINNSKSTFITRLNMIYSTYGHTFTADNLILKQLSDYTYFNEQPNSSGVDVEAGFEDQLSFDFDIPKDSSVTLSMFISTIEVVEVNDHIYISRAGHIYDDFGDTTSGSWFDSNGNYITDTSSMKKRFTVKPVIPLDAKNKIYEGGETKLVINKVTKAKIFDGTKTPYNYLIDLLKVINARIDYDVVNNKIFICSYDEYYRKHIVDINDLIDRSRDMQIDMNNDVPRTVTFGEKHDKTYVDILNDKVGEQQHGDMLLMTGNAFNANDLTVGSDSIFTSVSDYNLVSGFFGSPRSVTYNLPYPAWASMGNKRRLYESDTNHEFEYNGIISADLKFRDWMMKPCFFGEDNKPMQIDTTILLFNGVYDNTDPTKQRVRISDAVNEMYILNDTECYLDSMDEDVIIIPDELPMFNRLTKCELPNNIIGDVSTRDPNTSLKVNTDLSTYKATMYESRPISFGIERMDPSFSLDIARYYRYEKEQADRLYSRRTVYVTEYVKKTIEQLSMRDIYFFNGRYFIISDIEGGKVNDEFSKIKFMSINLPFIEPVEIKCERAVYDASRDEYVIPSTGDFISIRVSNIYDKIVEVSITETSSGDLDWVKIDKDELNDYGCHMIWVFNNDTGDQRRFTVTVSIEGYREGSTESYVFRQE